MGTWGVGVWQDDVAADCVIRFEELVDQGYQPAEAARRVADQSPWGDDEDDAAVWALAVAALQLRHGVLEPAVRDRALAAIDSGVPLWRWEDAAGAPVDPRWGARRAVLDQFRVLLVRGSAAPEELAAVTAPDR